METIQHEFLTSKDPATLYAAVSTPTGLKGWWSTNSDIATRVGDTTELRFDKQGTPVTMRFTVTELSEGKRVVWKCIDNANSAWVDSTLTWQISDAGDQRKLSFAHEGLKSAGPPLEMTQQGWKHFMKSLEQYVTTGNGEPWG